MLSDSVLFYAAVAASSFILGIVLARVVTRKTVSALEEKNHELESRVEKLKDVPEDSPAPPQKARFTGGEVASIITALAALVAAGGGFYINAQNTKSEKLSDEKARIESERDKFKAQAESFGSLLSFKQDEWADAWKSTQGIPKVGADVLLDGHHFEGNCKAVRVSWLYKGTDPAVLKCNAGFFQLKGTLRNGAVFLIRKIN